MCGIAGRLNFDGQPVARQTIKRMTDVIAHRGPDGEGHYQKGAVGLGHRRLAIIDLTEAASQPMCCEDGTIWLVYNGEIYNFQELRRQLISHGHVFRSNTDSEVILHAYEQWGVDCLKFFNGMFAFALWDERQQLLWLARDRLGIKPLFYAHLANAFLFASEIKAILENSDVNRGLDERALSYYLSLNYTPAPFTLFTQVRQLLPGHYLMVSPQGQIEDICYWDLHFEENNDSGLERYRTAFYKLLDESVRLRLVSDVPFGMFLSGGVDSSSVAYLMSRHLQEPVNTFTIGFAETSYDETGYARRVAQQIGACHRERLVDAKTAEVLPKIVWHSEEPTADSSMVAVYYVSQLAREHVTMALSGDGADETIAGYETYQAYYLHRYYSRLPLFLRQNIIRPLVSILPTSDRKISLDQKIRRFIAADGLTSEEAHGVWRMIFYPQMRQQLLAPLGPSADQDVLELYRQYFCRCNALHPLNRMLYVDTRFYLPNDMLVKVDRMSMAHGLEVREPFLDYRLVEFLATVPPRYKMKAFWNKKFLLKSVMRGKLPPATLNRKKAGFNVPNARWLRGDLRDFACDHLSSRRVREMGFLDPHIVEHLLHDHFSAKADYSHQIWCLLTLALWWQTFIQKSVQHE